MWAVVLTGQNPRFSICFAGENPLPPGGTRFEGRIEVSMTQGNQTENLLYSIGANFLRVELTAAIWPSPADILDRHSGELILVFPNNSSFMRLKPAAMRGAEMPPTPQLPPGIGPQSTPGSPSTPAAPGMPMQMPPMSPAAIEKLELSGTNEKTNILGYACERYEIKQRDQTMEIWATDELGPFQPYVRNQQPAASPRAMEEQWGALLKARGAFPLLAILKFENGQERLRFEVKSITPEKLTNASAKLFQPPANFHEVRPLPF